MKCTQCGADANALVSFPADETDPESTTISACGYCAPKKHEEALAEAVQAINKLRAEVKQVHELLDTNGVGLAGEPLMARVSDVVAEWKHAKS